ncbi:MAG: hypothetical protein AAGE84_22565 [Cyanobacteria bacterium P01_G01_bin.39]
MTKLTIGNTINIAWGVYRDRFKEYYRLAFINSFWIFVPVYGWAKYAAMMGLLARLAYYDVVGNAETVTEAKRHIKPKTWFFFGAGLMASLIFYLKLVLFLLLILILFFLAHSNLFSITISFILIFIGPTYYFYWLRARLFLYELPLAIEQNINATKSRDISWDLVTGSIFPIQVIIFCFSTFFGVLFIPIISSASVLYNLFINPFADFLNSNIILDFFSDTICIIFVVAFNALFIPFWQLLKAVTYYQLNLLSKSEADTLGLDRN